jgi:hypothetical protein
MQIKPKGYIASLLSYLDDWCISKVNFNKPIIQEAKNLGFDMEKLFKEQKKYVYLNGEIMLIPYGKFLTSNYILYGKTKNIKFVDYDMKTMNNVGFYRNVFLRTFQLFINKYTIPELGFDHCMDCAHAAYVLEEYAKAHDIKNIAEFVYDTVIAICQKKLLQDAHGYLFDTDKSTILKIYHHELFTRTLMRRKI